MKFLETWRRVAALFDKSAWLLIAPAFAVLFRIDAASAMTLVQWSLFVLVVAGVAVIISRIVFPGIDLADLVKRATANAHGSGIVAGSLILFVAAMIFSLVYWAKP